MADAYATGHLPKETFQQLVARVNSNSFLYDAPTAAQKIAKPRKGRKKFERILEAVEALTPPQVGALLELLEGQRSLVIHLGHSYAAKKTAEGWRICSTTPDSDGDHNVLSDLTACSCKDNRFRDRTCKHIRALRTLS